MSYAASGGDPRFAIWRTTPQMIAAHPFFGIGENQYPEASVRYGLYAEDLGGSYQHAHNIPLTIAAETGLLGLAALAWVAVALGRVLVGACRRLTGFDRGLATAVAAAFTGLALQGMVDYTVSSNTVAGSTLPGTLTSSMRSTLKLVAWLASSPMSVSVRPPRLARRR